MIRLLATAVALLEAVCLAAVPCNSTYGIDISDGDLFRNGSIAKGGVVYDPGRYVRKSNGTIGCICKIKPCLRKCCPMGQYLLNKTCQPSETPFKLREGDDVQLKDFHVVYGSNCNSGKRSLLSPELPNNLGKFIILKDGRLFLPKNKEYADQTNYCLDYIEDDSVLRALYCSNKIANISPPNIAGMIISMPFLLATFIVYAILPDRNLHGKSLMCYVITLMGAYFLLVLVQLFTDYVDDTSCISIGVACYFFFMVSFFFMNIMAIDIWWTFSGLRGFSGTRKESERKRFVLYSCYAWGVPLALVVVVTALTVSVNLSPNVWYNPGMANGQCWFDEGYPRLLYFYGPISLLLMSNTVLFIITAYKIKKVQKDTAVLKQDANKKHSYDNDKQLFNLYVKLLLAMGINWTTEIVSWLVIWQYAVVPIYIWYLTDFINAAYGVLIFFIFVFKRNVWRMLKKRYYEAIGRPELANMPMTDYSPNTSGRLSNPQSKMIKNGHSTIVSVNETGIA